MKERQETHRAAAAAAPSPRAWSHDLEPVRPTWRREPAWESLVTVRAGLGGNVRAALYLRGRDAAARFVDVGPKGSPEAKPVWPADEDLGALIIPPRRSSRPMLFALDARAARHFGRSVEDLRGLWLARWGVAWEALEEQARHDRRKPRPAPRRSR